MGAELFHADGQKDMTKLIVDFRSFANAPEKVKAKFALEQAMKEVDV
jgi:nitrogen fixation/metabolism regulation signal transduction histidine kinase